jgi:hypothetical protein
MLQPCDENENILTENGSVTETEGNAEEHGTTCACQHIRSRTSLVASRSTFRCVVEVAVTCSAS